MLTTDQLANAILSNINSIKIDVPNNTVKSDGSVDISTSQTTIGAASSPQAAKLNKDMANAIAKAIVDNLKNLEIANGQITITGGIISNTLMGATVSGGPATAVGGAFPSETGTVSVPPGAIK